MLRTLVGGLAAGLLSLAFYASPVPAQTSDVAGFPDFVGHDHGERITVHHQMESYLRYLAAHSDRVEIVEQGESWEGRQLLLAIVTSPANHTRLAEIKATAQRLGDPRELSDDEAQALIADQPSIVFMGGSIHGFELSGAEGVLKLLHQMTTRSDPETLAVLDNVVLLLDPMINPDGRDAFAHRNHRSIGRKPKSERDDWSNDFTRWDAVGYRTGHYFFDTNRDWWAHTQRETQARVPTIRDWRPQVVIDLHEMGSDVEFYFDPPDIPYGPYFPEFAKSWFVKFGEAYAEAFDEAGFEYMTRERYNFFYPGYTTSWGSYQGAVGMLYEQGSTRGLALERADESVRLLTDALEQQYTAAWTAARTAATGREELLSDYVSNLRAAIADGQRGVRRYLIEPGGDSQHLAELVSLLERNGIEVGQLAEAASLSGVRDRAGEPVGDRSFDAGTYVVEAAQPGNRLVRALLEPDLPLPDDFLEIARERIDRGSNPRFYDITAWSLPLLFDLPGYSSTDGRSLTVESVDTITAEAMVPDERADYAYLIDGDQAASVAALLDLKRAGYRAAVTLKPTSIAEEPVPTGTAVLRVGQNDDSLHEAMREVADRRGLTVRSVDTGLADPGYPSLGSADVMPFRLPEIALLGDDPVHGYSFGWAWYTLDRQYEIPVTVRTARSIRSEPIHRFDVLVIPHLFSPRELGRLLGDEGKDRLTQWVEDGGSLVAIGSAVDFVREELELSGLRSWYDVETGRDKMSAEEKKENPIDPVDQPTRFNVPGAILAADFDPEAWLSAGYGDSIPVLVDSSRIYVAPEGPPDSDKRVVARYAEADARLSGFLWPESAERLPGAVFAYEERIGDGRVVLFAEDLNFRAYWRGANRLFLNAVVLSPSAP